LFSTATADRQPDADEAAGDGDGDQHVPRRVGGGDEDVVLGVERRAVRVALVRRSRGVPVHA
jgi:hypothetical protein